MGRTVRVEVLSDLDRVYPYGVCPYCKAISQVRADCEQCGSTGWLNERSWKGSPPMLTRPRTGEHVVAWKGDIVLVKKFDDPWGQQ
jgi:hypothetical protein